MGDGQEQTQAAALLAAGLILPVLDGVDEIPEQVRGPAISRINDALRPGGQVVVTCRTQQYRDAVRPADGLEATLRAAAAIQLRPLDPETVRDYLCDDAAGPVARSRWDPVLAALSTEAPAGQALRTPLMVGLARAIYNPRPGGLAGTLRDQAELCSPALADRAAVESLLFDAFIPAAYGQDPASRWKAQDAERWLVLLARHLERTMGSSDLAWWQLPLAVRGFPGIAAVIVGTVVGAGIAAVAGAGLGLWGYVIPGALCWFLAAIVVGAEAARVETRKPAHRIGFRLSGRDVAMLGVIAAACGVAVWALVVFGLAAGAVEGVVEGVVVGAGMGFLGWAIDQRFASLDLSSAVSPPVTLKADRRTGTAMAVITGVIAGIVAGILFSAPIAGVVLGAAALVVSSFVLAVWPSFEMARICLVLRHRLPWALMSFLADAHQRGVLRQAGAVYQFRHIELQHRLATREPEVARIGSSFAFRRGASDAYSVALEKVIDPAQGADRCNTPDTGKRFVGAVFRISTLSGGLRGEDANNAAALIGSNGETYHADAHAIARYTNFDTGLIHAARFKTVTGAVTFQVPAGVRVKKVQWTARSRSTYTILWDMRGWRAWGL